jgi:hypothetical protein
LAEAFFLNFWISSRPTSFRAAHAVEPARQHSDQCLCDWQAGPSRACGINLLHELLLEAEAFYLLDRGYVDFACLYTFTQACAFFVTRAKKNKQFYRRSTRPIEPSTGVGARLFPIPAKAK